MKMALTGEVSRPEASFQPRSLITDAAHSKNNQPDRTRQELHEELRVILDSVPAWVFYKDAGNNFLRVNKAFCDVMGMSREELEGRSCFDLYPREQAEAFWRDDQEVMSSGAPKRNIVEPMDSKSGKRWVQTDKMPCRDVKGNIIGIIAFCLDITARKNAEDALRASHAEEKRMRQEQEQLAGQLKAALAKMRTLDSLLPICAVCKKIRDEKGEWQCMEAYISSRTDTAFTHGYCPECAEKMQINTRTCEKCGNGLKMMRFVHWGNHYRRYYCEKCGSSQDFVRKEIEYDSE